MVTGRNQQHFTKNICRKIKITNNMKKGRENDNAIQHSDNNEKMNLRSIVDSRYVAAAAACKQQQQLMQPPTSTTASTLHRVHIMHSAIYSYIHRDAEKKEPSFFCMHFLVLDRNW